jgi:hypothetical protein
VHGACVHADLEPRLRGDGKQVEAGPHPVKEGFALGTLGRRTREDPNSSAVELPLGQAGPAARSEARWGVDGNDLGAPGLDQIPEQAGIGEAHGGVLDGAAIEQDSVVVMEADVDAQRSHY